jgi:hypothetical protein
MNDDQIEPDINDVVHFLRLGASCNGWELRVGALGCLSLTGFVHQIKWLNTLRMQLWVEWSLRYLAAAVPWTRES